MSAWDKEPGPRYGGAEVPPTLSHGKLKMVLEFEYRKWPYILLSAFFGLCAAFVAWLHISQHVSFVFYKFLTAEGGLATGFVVLAGWTVYVSRPKVKIPDKAELAGR